MKRYSLYTVVPIVFLVLISVNFAVISFSVERHENDLLEAAVEEKIHLAETINQGITSLTWTNLPMIKETFVTEMANFQDVRYIRIVNSDGTIYQSSIKGESGQFLDNKDISRVISSGKEIVKDDFYENEFIKLVIFPGHQDVTIWIGFTLDAVQETIQNIWFRDILIILSILGFSILALLMILYNIINPLSEITFACKKVMKGNLDVKIPVTSQTEIGELAVTFNKTIAALKESYSSLTKANQQTEEEKNKTLAIIRNFDDGLLFFDEENELALVNPQAELFLGVKARKIIKKPVLELTKIEPLKKIIQISGRRSPTTLKIKKVIRKELFMGPDLILEGSVIPILRKRKFRATGRRAGTLVIFHDVTREKRIERMKTEFVSIAAHQLRTPLSAIKWTLKMLLTGDMGKVSKKQKEFMEKTYKSNERMITLINDLLDVSRIEEGKHLYKKVSSDIEKICKNVIKLYKREIKEKALEFKFITPGKLPKVMVDKEKIEIAIKNIFENAIRYTPPKGKVAISLATGKKQIEVSISDTGVGIPENQQHRLFTKFFRGANIIRMETEGTGLGLFIAKNIIEAHKGRIWFESQEGKGSTFYLTLPIV